MTERGLTTATPRPGSPGRHPVAPRETGGAGPYSIARRTPARGRSRPRGKQRPTAVYLVGLTQRGTGGQTVLASEKVVFEE